MPRRLRIEFEGAIHLVMARGDARQDIVRGDDRRRIVADLERVVARARRDFVGLVVMTDHLPLLVPIPSLRTGLRRISRRPSYRSQRPIAKPSPAHAPSEPASAASAAAGRARTRSASGRNHPG